MTTDHWDRSSSPVAVNCLGLVGAAGLVISAAAMPWATYKIANGPTRHLNSGSWSLPLIVLGVASAVLALREVWNPRRWLAVARCVGGAAALLVSAVSALARIADANSFVSSAASTTAVSYGPLVALLASLTIAVASVAVATQRPQRKMPMAYGSGGLA